MKKLMSVLVCMAFTSLTLATAVPRWQPQDQDKEGCKDHALFSRMPNYHIIDCESVDFDARKFPVGSQVDADLKPKHVEVEGIRTLLLYGLNEGAKPASGLQIMRNFENAAKKAGGTVQGTYPEWCKAMVEYDPRLGNGCANWGVSMKFGSAGKEIWAYMQVMDEGYGIQIMERKSMNQDITANAAELQQGLSDTGHVAVYDILFDTGKSEIKPESEAALKEIAKLMAQNATLKLHVVGHTDNVGDIAMNMKLSQARAASVVTALTARHGVAANRLSSFGVGPYAPVASNKTEEGRARNRRVELVEQ